jgi:hypothetical protein
MLPDAPLPDVPVVPEPALADEPLVEPGLVVLEPLVVEPPPDALDPELVVEPLEPMRALVSMNCPLPIREVDAAPAVPLVPVAPAVLLLPPERHPVTVIARLLLEL